VAKLIYSTIASVDGYVADAAGAFQWAAPDEEVFAFVNELERPIGTYLFGRRMYETMVSWETAADLDEHPVEREFARLWRAADKVVYSTSLASVASARTRIERGFDPGAVRSLKTAADRDLTVGGPDLAEQALEAGLVDELQLFAVPVLVGGGTPAFPSGVRLDLDLLDERRFAAGTVYRRYRVAGS
jgi:dihydrofolate reductase